MFILNYEILTKVLSLNLGTNAIRPSKLNKDWIKPSKGDMKNT
jgi:hypothetical protein